MSYPVLFWVGFHLLIGALLAIDLFVFHRKHSVSTFKKACSFSGFWIAIALLFNAFIYLYLGSSAGLQFFTGYLIEKSLSVDNLFLFLVIFTHFKIPLAHQHHVLFWGILGVFFFRISLILAGITLLSLFHWIFYVFGAFLLISGMKLFFQDQTKKDRMQSRFFFWLQRTLPVSTSHRGTSFFVIEKGKWKVTRLFLILALIEITDVLFALDSIPAVFAVTTDPFIVYTSNIFAILGLRSLYFVLASSLDKLYYLKAGLAFILSFIGFKMLVSDFLSISLLQSLAIIAISLGIASLASLFRVSHPKK